MKLIVFNSFLFLAVCFSHAESIKFKGIIGAYPIELTITEFNKDENSVLGFYKYSKSKTGAFLELKGELSGTCMRLDEFSNNENTGSFYLEIEGDSLIGKWINGKKGFDVSLERVAGDLALLKTKSEKELSALTNDAISGTYAVSYLWVNDMWFYEEVPSAEIGFNGGEVAIQQLSKDQIRFEVMMVCGPTYHMAMAAGIAQLKGEEYIFEEEECSISLMFSNKKLTIKANHSSDCGFGARAYLDHEVWKVSDTYGFLEE